MKHHPIAKNTCGYIRMAQLVPIHVLCLNIKQNVHSVNRINLNNGQDILYDDNKELNAIPLLF